AAANVVVGLDEPDAVARATATDPGSLSKEQAAVAQWLARRYRVATEPVAALVSEAWAIGRRAGLEPTLILAVIAIESSFNPFAQSPVGAQGLMQVMTRVHDDKYGAFGGTHAAFDPITNLRVGVQVLKECIARAGSVAEGLRYYVGAAALASDGGYAGRVLAEQQHLRAVAEGRRVPVSVPNTGQPAPEKVAALHLGGSSPAR
ncbi:MAG: lytic transglycosylase domain-containing protein, partial [Burkholderiaceae bacterium]|nr:lytic transglycosylase domain-containing protein [Burkholderiaceae bacterium]